MDRDRDEPRRMPGRGGRERGDDRTDPPSSAGKLDPADWDTPFDPVPVPSPAARARGDADSAKAVSLLSALETSMQRILANFGMIRDLVADARASSAEADARATQRAEADKARDEAIAARLVHPAALEARAEAGARRGAEDGLAGAGEALRRRIDTGAAAQTDLIGRFAADAADRRTHEMRRRRGDRWWNGALAAFALLVPVALGYGYHLGDGAGEAEGYARTRDEVAAASWANTTNGKLARQLDQASQLTIPDIASCPKDNGWHSEKRQGIRYCFATNTSAKPITGWPLP